MVRKMNVIIGSFIIASFIAAPLFADQLCEKSGKEQVNFKEKKEAISCQLKLTPEQDKLLKEARLAHRDEMKKLMQALGDKRKELKTALANPKVTRQDIGPIVAQIKGVQAQLVDYRVDSIFRIKEILSPEQYQKLQAMKNGRQSRRHEKHQEEGF